MKNTFALFLFLIFSNAFAGELYQPALPIRCMAMGGTCISHVRGAQALFLNAATLTRVEGFDFIVAQVQAGVSSDTINLVQNSNSTLTASDIQNVYGKTLYADVTARSGFVMPYFGAGVYSHNFLTESFGNPTFPTFNANYISDYGYTIATAIPLGSNNTSFGIAGRSAKRWGGVQDISVLSLVGTSTQDMLDQYFPDHGNGNALDLSLMTTLPGDLKPTFAFVWQDVGSTRYQMTSGVQDPPSQKDNLTFGASIQHDFALADWTHSIEYKFIRTENEDFSKKIHLGTEASYGMIDLRAGLNQGYVTYGAGVDLWLFQVEAAVYATELGTYAGQTRSDRYSVGLTIDIDLDQSFKVNWEGKRRRLKQRR